MTEKLKKCPFCGKAGGIDDLLAPAYHGEGCLIRLNADNAKDYYLHRPFRHTKEDMQAAWNARPTCTNDSTYADCDLFTCSNCGQSQVVQRVDYDIDAYYTIDEAFGNDDADMCDADLRFCPSCGHEVVDEPCSR